jgi:hypothetical protein
MAVMSHAEPPPSPWPGLLVAVLIAIVLTAAVLYVHGGF